MKANSMTEQMFPMDMVFPGRVLSGVGCIDSFQSVSRTIGARGVIVYSRSVGCTDVLRRMMGETTSHDVIPWRYDGGEPTLEQVEDILQVARGHGVEWIAGVGGGSVLDCAKAAAGLLDAPGAVADYHAGRAIDARGVPFLAVPTTAGSGSEATMVAVLSDPEKALKRSIRAPHFIARAAFLDGTVMRDLPRAQAAHSGMDALVQAIESFCSRNHTRLTDQFAREALQLILENLLPFCHDRTDEKVAHAMLMGSYLAGLALSGARLGVVHGLAHPVGIHTGLGHGLVCAIALPHVLRFNRASDPARFAELDACCGGSIDTCVADMMAALDIPDHLSHAFPEDPEPMLNEILASGSTAANPRAVSRDDALQLLRAMYK